MRPLVPALALLLAPAALPAQRFYDPDQDAQTIDAALAAARADGTLVFVDFGADWQLPVSTRNGALESGRNMDAAERRRLADNCARRR